MKNWYKLYSQHFPLTFTTLCPRKVAIFMLFIIFEVALALFLCYSLFLKLSLLFHAQGFFQAFGATTFSIWNLVYWVPLAVGEHNELPQMTMFGGKISGKYACVVLNPRSLIVIIKYQLKVITKSTDDLFQDVLPWSSVNKMCEVCFCCFKISCNY